MTTTTETWLTQKQAAELASCSVDTVKRRRQDGSLDGCRQDPTTNAWLIPLSALVAAGMYEPTDEDPREVLDAGRAARELTEVSTALAVEQARVEQLDLRIGELGRQNEELLKLLRRLGGQGRAA